MEPQVFLIAESVVDMGELKRAMNALGGKIALDWVEKQKDRPRNGELLDEVSGRICYKSHGLGLNPNITKIREDSKLYFDNTLSKGDGSILEHSSCSFAFVGVSRVFSHELVRHRAGVAISQESLRYVRPTDFNAWLPADTPLKIKEALKKEMDSEFASYKKISESIDWDSMTMLEKKKITSTLRRMLPDGIATNMIWSANFRTLRHVIVMRTSEVAETEIRLVFDKVAQIVTRKFPLVFQDFSQGPELPDGSHIWTSKYHKV
jgi:thymidylate synthase (FAD)